MAWLGVASVRTDSMTATRGVVSATSTVVSGGVEQALNRPNMTNNRAKRYRNIIRKARFIKISSLP